MPSPNESLEQRGPRTLGDRVDFILDLRLGLRLSDCEPYKHSRHPKVVRIHHWDSTVYPPRLIKYDVDVVQGTAVEVK